MIDIIMAADLQTLLADFYEKVKGMYDNGKNGL